MGEDGGNGERGILSDVCVSMCEALADRLCDVYEYEKSRPVSAETHAVTALQVRRLAASFCMLC